MKTRTKHLVGALSASALFLGLLAASQTASATTGIQNTRHNLGSGNLAIGASTGTRVGSGGMGDVFTNGTDEICVFCHTPHGANTGTNLPPLWNKGTLASTTYTVYTSGTMNGTAGANLNGHMSLACLSCHDGTQAMDNMINAPGQGGFNKGAGGYMSGKRLGTTSSGGGAGADWYAGTNNIAAADQNSVDTGGGALATGAGVDFIGTDLSNDHPIGMAYCGGGQASSGSNAGCSDQDFNAANSGLGGMFEVGAGAAGLKTKMRIYGTTLATATVECGSCHDPHTDTYNTFLRTSNSGSGVCLTCHVK